MVAVHSTSLVLLVFGEVTCKVAVFAVNLPFKNGNCISKYLKFTLNIVLSIHLYSILDEKHDMTLYNIYKCSKLQEDNFMNQTTCVHRDPYYKITNNYWQHVA